MNSALGPTTITDLRGTDRVVLTNTGQHPIIALGIPLSNKRGASYIHRNGNWKFTHYLGHSRSHSRKIAKALSSQPLIS